jgi:hypothetical protein
MQNYLGFQGMLNKSLLRLALSAIAILPLIANTNFANADTVRKNSVREIPVSRDLPLQQPSQVSHSQIVYTAMDINPLGVIIADRHRRSRSWNSGEKIHTFWKGTSSW